MRTVWTKTLIGAFTAAALAASAFASPAEARGGDIFPRGGHGGGHATAFHGGGMRGGRSFAGGGFRGGNFAWRGGGRGGYNGGGYYGGGYYNGFGPALGLGVLGLATGALLGAPYASADEGCLVRQPIWSHGRIVGHRWIDAC